MTATEHVILVDKNDNPVGTAEKLHAHRENLCHRAFSVFIFREAPDSIEVLLQQRAASKYHSPLLWTNTCCSHPRPGEEIIDAGRRRLKEEMGFETSLVTAGHFHYIAHFNNGLTENEVDHVLVGHYEGEFVPSVEEVASWRWARLSELDTELNQFPERFTPWFAEAWGLAKKAVPNL